jgi:hypothetical protein
MAHEVLTVIQAKSGESDVAGGQPHHRVCDYAHQTSQTHALCEEASHEHLALTWLRRLSRLDECCGHGEASVRCTALRVTSQGTESHSGISRVHHDAVVDVGLSEAQRLISSL